MRRILLLTTATIAQVAQCYHQSCLKQEGSIGDAEGDLVSDFELLDLQATKDMRLAQLNICKDKKNRLIGLQVELGDPNSEERLILNSIGDLSQSSKGSECVGLALSSPIEILELGRTDKRGVDALKLTKDGNSKLYGKLEDDKFKLDFLEE